MMVGTVLGLCAMGFAGVLWIRAYVNEYRAYKRELRQAEEKAAEEAARAEYLSDIYRRLGRRKRFGTEAY